MRLYWEVARRSLQRQLVYRTENLAGLFTNAFFGYIRAAVFVAVYQSQSSATIGGYDQQAAVSYSWVTQALIMIIALWGWWDVEETIRTGDVVSDLSKPFWYVGFWMARDLGRAGYFVVFRALPVLLVGQVTFGLTWPGSASAWVMATLSMVLAVVVSFGWRFLINISAFWTTDAHGLGNLANTATMFLGGFVVPIRFFPEWAQAICLVLPFASMTQAPADLFVGRIQGVDAVMVLLGQLVWAIVMLALAQIMTMVATRRVVVQGG
jgi:ABC-2 type transport system permease protein